MKIKCASKKQNYLELQVAQGGGLHGSLILTSSENSGGDRRSDKSSVFLRPDDAFALAKALLQYHQEGTVPK